MKVPARAGRAYSAFLAALTVVALTAAESRAEDDVARRMRLLSIGFDLHTLVPERRSVVPPAGVGDVWSTRIIHSSDTPITVHVHADVPGTPSAWLVRVVDRDDQMVEELRGDEPCWKVGGCWTAPVPHGEAVVQLRTVEPVADVEVVVDMYRSEKTPTAVSGTVGEDEKKDFPAFASATARAIGRSVVRLALPTVGGYCSGFLVAPDLVLTNEHCIANEADALNARVDFKYEKPKPEPEQRLRVASLQALDHGLDYALVRLRTKPTGAYPPVALELGAPLAKPAKLIVVQHPGGDYKKVSEKNCDLSALGVAGVGGDTTDFVHTCDTAQGSSGSPVVSAATGRVVGLHHWGPDETNTPLNQAVAIGLVLQHIRNKWSPDLADEIESP